MPIKGLTGESAAKNSGASGSFWGNCIGTVYKGAPKNAKGHAGADLLNGFRLEGSTPIVQRALENYFQRDALPVGLKLKAPDSVLAEEIPIRLIHDDPDDCLTSSMACFPKGKCDVICDGETVSKLRIGDRLTPVSKPCICKANGSFAEVKGKAISCTPRGKLRFVIHGFPIAGHFAFNTGGSYDLGDINKSLYDNHYLVDSYGKSLKDVPFILYRSQAPKIANKQRRNLGVIQIRIDENYAQAIANTFYRNAIASAHSPTLALPSTPVDDIPDADFEEVQPVDPDYGLPMDVDYKKSQAWTDIKIRFDAARTSEQVVTAYNSAIADPNMPAHAKGAIDALRDRAFDRVDQMLADSSGVRMPEPEEPHPNQTLLINVSQSLFPDSDLVSDLYPMIGGAISSCCPGKKAADLTAEEVIAIWRHLALVHAESEGLDLSEIGDVIDGLEGDVPQRLDQWLTVLAQTSEQDLVGGDDAYDDDEEF